MRAASRSESPVAIPLSESPETRCTAEDDGPRCQRVPPTGRTHLDTERGGLSDQVEDEH